MNCSSKEWVGEVAEALQMLRFIQTLSFRLFCHNCLKLCVWANPQHTLMPLTTSSTHLLCLTRARNYHFFLMSLRAFVFLLLLSYQSDAW